MRMRTNVLVLGTADWNQPIATNQHYLIRELCRDSSLSVTFVESMGLRRPTLSRRDLSRICSRVAHAANRGTNRAPSSSREVPPGLVVRSPLVLPAHRGLPARMNRPLVLHTVSEWIRSKGPKVLWTYTPTTYGLETFADRVYYHCVDLLGEFDGVDRRVVYENEIKLARANVMAIASSKVVKTHLRDMGFKDVLLWENVADTFTIAKAEPQSSMRIAGKIVFAGNLSPKKLDYELLREMGRNGLKIALAGPRAEGGGTDEDEFSSLMELGMEYLGGLDLSDLAKELSTSSVGIIPYELNAYTRGVSPLKTFEYLAAGLPVVSTALPGVSSIEGHVWVENNHTDFLRRVEGLSTGVPSAQEVGERIRIAQMHSWSGRGEEVRTLVREGHMA